MPHLILTDVEQTIHRYTRYLTGSGYKQGDVILITGNNLGGLTPK